MDTGVTEGQTTAWVRALGGGMGMGEFGLLQSKPIYPVISQRVLNSTDPGQIYSQYLPCASDILVEDSQGSENLVQDFTHK